MNSAPLRIRRATTDDLQNLKMLWDSMRLPANEFEKRLTDFQIVESVEQGFLGAIGIQMAGRNGRLYGEAYTDFSVADAARELFWDRARTIAAHNGVFRLWTQENSPFWVRWGFHAATPEITARLPQDWNETSSPWLTIQLKDEEAIASVEQRLDAFKLTEKQRTAGTLAQARSMITTITVIGFGIGIVLIGVAIYLCVSRGLLRMR